jgi:hypothetical protein
MDKFSAEQSAKTPFLSFDPVTGVFDMQGKSIPENSVLFYKPLFDWLETYFAGPAKTTTLNVKLDYFNTSSAKCIVDLFKKLEGFGKKGNDVTINWLYDEVDDDMQEAGDDYKSIIKVPFNLISFIK